MKQLPFRIILAALCVVTLFVLLFAPVLRLSDTALAQMDTESRIEYAGRPLNLIFISEFFGKHSAEIELAKAELKMAVDSANSYSGLLGGLGLGGDLAEAAMARAVLKAINSIQAYITLSYITAAILLIAAVLAAIIPLHKAAAGSAGAVSGLLTAVTAVLIIIPVSSAAAALKRTAAYSGYLGIGGLEGIGGMISVGWGPVMAIVLAVGIIAVSIILLAIRNKKPAAASARNLGDFGYNAQYSGFGSANAYNNPAYGGPTNGSATGSNMPTDGGPYAHGVYPQGGAAFNDQYGSGSFRFENGGYTYQPSVTPPQPNYAQPNYAQPNYAQPNYAQQNYAQQNYAQQNYAQQNYAQPNYAQQNYAPQNYGPSASIVGISGCMQGRSFDASNGSPMLIGRDPSVCSIALDQSNLTIGRQHCVVTFVPNANMYTVRDLSRNGTFLGDMSGRLPENTPVDVPKGSVIYLSDGENAFRLD